MLLVSIAKQCVQEELRGENGEDYLWIDRDMSSSIFILFEVMEFFDSSYENNIYQGKNIHQL